MHLSSDKFSKDKDNISLMFDEISPVYDFLNHFFSLGNDIKWRKKAISMLSGRKYNNVLDLAAGTGDLSCEMLKLNPNKIFSVDISDKMLKRAACKIKSDKNYRILADAEHLPFNDYEIDLTGVAFGIRNFENLQDCLKEINRVLSKEGLFLVIEMFRPQRKNILHKAFNFYFTRIVPFLGTLISRNKYAYSYLKYSVFSFFNITEFIFLLKESGFEVIDVRNNFLDFVYTVLARKKS